MTKEEIAVLGHAFFDGKVIQYESSNEPVWLIYNGKSCPDFKNGEWRIKPDEPKTITICTFLDESDGEMRITQKDSEGFKDYVYNGWTHIKSLDQVVEVE